MKIFNLYKFNKDELETFIEFSNLYWEEKWMICLNSTGGQNTVVYHIIEIMNLKQELFENVEISVTCAYSNAFRLLMEFKGKVNILRSCIGMWHLCWEDIDVFVDGSRIIKLNGNEAEVMEHTNRVLVDRDRKFSKRFLIKEQYNKYKKGIDIFFTETEMKELMKNRF